MEITWRVISGEGENGGKGIGNKKHKWSVQNRHREVKAIMGNGEAEELICMTHGHELQWENAGGRACAGQTGKKGRKKWDNCNSIINNIYLKIKYYFQKVCLWESKEMTSGY